MSVASAKAWPQNRGNDGKHSEASTWPMSMSPSRGATCQAPGCISSKVMPTIWSSSRGNATAEWVRTIG